eukprot:TRINITY_DN10524_c0_g1_i1.p1 TRINITY_DN10524_c0_g1~~TRINITY_DN10524_c0_g1_i1.p1  ORF type:complete len:604 (+),score=107.17 TRINITY_DN10524_c0_g1_i1:54-1814(+)
MEQDQISPEDWSNVVIKKSIDLSELPVQKKSSSVKTMTPLKKKLRKKKKRLDSSTLARSARMRSKSKSTLDKGFSANAFLLDGDVKCDLNGDEEVGEVKSGGEAINEEGVVQAEVVVDTTEEALGNAEGVLGNAEGVLRENEEVADEVEKHVGDVSHKDDSHDGFDGDVRMLHDSNNMLTVKNAKRKSEIQNMKKKRRKSSESIRELSLTLKERLMMSDDADFERQKSIVLESQFIDKGPFEVSKLNLKPELLDFDSDDTFCDSHERGIVRFTLRVPKYVYRKLDRVSFILIGATPELNDWQIYGKERNIQLKNLRENESFCYKTREDRVQFDDIYSIHYVDVEIDLPTEKPLGYNFVMKSKGSNSKSEYQLEFPRLWRCKIPESLGQKRYYAPIDTWMDPVGHTSEHKHTARFYVSIRKQNLLHFNRIEDRIWVGTCPRNLEHVLVLKDHGITCVVNFQDHDDVNKLSPDVEKMYIDEGMLYIWLPTKDFSRDSKRLMIPHASFILKGLLDSGHTLYVHCNAGVGRSVAAVCGYYLNCTDMTLGELSYRLVSKRNVSYISTKALKKAVPDYKLKFSKPLVDTHIE